jgi:transcriptional regulator with XRE-family HTH domain
MKAIAKPTDMRGSEGAALQPDDRVGVRTALPFRLERLGDSQPSRSETRQEPSPRAAGAVSSRPMGATSEPGHRPTLKAVDTHVGARIRLRRHLLGMSQTTLAKALGISFQQLQKYERGLNRISASRLNDLGRALDTSISSFFDDMPASIGETSAVPLGNENGGGLNDPELDTLHRRETLSRVRAYYNLEDPEVRRHILILVGSLGSPN